MYIVLVKPHPGANRKDISGALDDVYTAAVNARSTHHSHTRDRYISYPRWAYDSVERLRNQIGAADIDRLIMTKRYWALQAALNPGIESIDQLIDIELAERVSALEAVRAELNGIVERWNGHEIFLVPDTTFFIRYPQRIDEWDLSPLLEIGECPVHIVIPIAVVDELDNLKQSRQRDETRWRAALSLAVLDRILEEPTKTATLRQAGFTPILDDGVARGAITVEVFFDPPAHRRMPIPDDEIIDRAAAIKDLAARDVRFITYDTGQSMRSRAQGCGRISSVVPMMG